MAMKTGSQNVLPSGSVNVPAGDPGPSREDGAGITSSTPIEQRGAPGRAGMSTPARRGPMQYYGKRPR